MSKQFVFDESGIIKLQDEIPKKVKSDPKYKVGDTVQCQTSPRYIGVITHAPLEDFETLYVVEVGRDNKSTTVVCVSEEEIRLVKQ